MNGDYQKVSQQGGDISLQLITSHENISHGQNHLVIGTFIKSIVYAGIDGVINTTIILLTGVSSNTSVQQLFAICVSAIVVGAIDMALCDYVSSKSEMQFINKEQKRQLFEIQHFLIEQKKQMIAIYQARSYSLQDSQRLAELIATSTPAFINIMMMEQLGLVKITDLSMPIKCGIATFIAFLVSSTISFSPYLVTWGVQKSPDHPWIPVLCISTVQLISLGIAQAKIIGIRAWKSATQFFILGVVATSIGYGIGQIMPS